VPFLSRSKRPDPWWGFEGAAARRTRRRRKAKAAFAFSVSMAAVAAAVAGWAIYLGFASALGLRAALPIG
jgi:hypothetical protein